MGKLWDTLQLVYGIPQISFNPERPMLQYAIGFFVIALIAALFGFGGIAVVAAGVAVDLAQILFGVFAALALVTFLASLVRVH